MPGSPPQKHQDVGQFRKEALDEGILHEGDTLGTDDETLLWVFWREKASARLRTGDTRRFLRARKYDIKQAKGMLRDCQEWRRTVEGVGIDELYQEIDPFDVSYTLSPGMAGDPCRIIWSVSRTSSSIWMLAYVVPQGSPNMDRDDVMLNCW